MGIFFDKESYSIIYLQTVCVMTPCVISKLPLRPRKIRGNFWNHCNIMQGVSYFTGFFYIFVCIIKLAILYGGDLFFFIGGTLLYMFLKVKYENKKRDVYICMYYIVNLKINNLLFLKRSIKPLYIVKKCILFGSGLIYKHAKVKK